MCSGEGSEFTISMQEWDLGVITSSLILSTSKNANRMLVIRKRVEHKMRNNIILCINPYYTFLLNIMCCPWFQKGHNQTGKDSEKGSKDMVWFICEKPFKWTEISQVWKRDWLGKVMMDINKIMYFLCDMSSMEKMKREEYFTLPISKQNLDTKWN